MIGIITCIRHFDSANDFRTVQSLLYATIKTLEKQTDQRLKLYIVCNVGTNFDIDTFINYELIYTNLACPPPVDVVDDDSQLMQWESVRNDKGFKYYLGLQKAHVDSMEYTMFIDADDYLHKGVVDFIQRNKTEFDGIIVDKGYSYSKSSNFIGAITRFNKVCGTCNSFSMQLLSEFIVNKSFNSHQAMFADVSEDFVLRVLGSHLNGASFITEQGGKVGNFPFYAVMYRIANGENDSMVSDIIGYPKLLTTSVIDDFSLARNKQSYVVNFPKLMLSRFLYLSKPKFKALKKIALRIKQTFRK